MPSRRDVQFLSNGENCRAWLYAQPKTTIAPIIVLAHGLGGTREMRLDAFAERFFAAGYSCLVFDYRHFGASDGQPRQLLDVGKQLEDWASAIRYAKGLDLSTNGQVVLWGSSFGGGHVLAAAAKNPGVTAVISQCPFTDGLASTLALNPISSLRVTLLALWDQLNALFGRKPVMVALAGKPGDAALMCAPDALPGYAGLQPKRNGDAIPNQVAARFALQIIRYFPGRLAKKIDCPVLACVCDPDSVAPTRATLKHLRNLKQGTVKTYPYGHFEIYVGKVFETVVSDQIAFLSKWLPTTHTGETRNPS